MHEWICVGSLTLCLVSCKATAKGTWEDMKQAGCKGDVTAFEQHIDKTRVKQAVMTAAGVEEKSLLGGVASNAVRDSLDSLTDEVKKGSSGAVCGWTYVDSAENFVRFNSVTGDEHIAKFEKYDDRWLLVEFGKRDR